MAALNQDGAMHGKNVPIQQRFGEVVSQCCYIGGVGHPGKMSFVGHPELVGSIIADGRRACWSAARDSPWSLLSASYRRGQEFMWITRIDYRLKIVSHHLDTSPAGRIIKDVMRHQIGEGEEAKNRRKKVADRSATGFKNENAKWDLLMNEKIDPAQFFDPAEFGARG